MEYGALLPPGFVVPKSSFHIRKDLTTSNPFGGVVIRPGDVVMDCGSHIGTFAAAALESGAAVVYCFEPEPRNLAYLRANLAPYASRVVLNAAALVPSGRPPIAVLMLSGFTGAHSLVKVPRAKHKRLQVAAVDFRDALITIQPQVLKMDVESAEYDLLDGLRAGDLGSVASLFVEFHPIDDRDRRVAHVREFIRREGFTETELRLRRYTAMRA